MPNHNQEEIHPGMLGISVTAIEKGKHGYCLFPVGELHSGYAGGRVWEKVRIHTIEPVREKRDVIVADEQGGVKEHTPVEISYQDRTDAYQRVTLNNPFPVLNLGTLLEGSELFDTAVGAAADFYGTALEVDQAPGISILRVYVVMDAVVVLSVRRINETYPNGVSEALNGGVALTANAAYVFDVPVIQGEHINFQCTVGGTVVTMFLMQLV